VTSFYEFTLPVSGKKLTWKPLTMGRSLDITASHQLPNLRYLVPVAMLSARIIGVDGKEGQPTMNEMRELDEFDMEAFSDEVEQKEAARKALFRKERLGVDAFSTVDKAIEDAQTAASALGMALKMLSEARQLAEQSNVPLGTPKT
jgi:hypothetical protein